MSDVDKILSKLKISVTLWKQISDTVKCEHSNNATYVQNKIYENSKDLLIFTAIKHLNKKRKTYEKWHNGVLLEFVRISNDIVLETHYNDQSYNLMCSISHKIREPLTSMIGMLSLMDVSDMGSHQKKKLYHNQ